MEDGVNVLSAAEGRVAGLRDGMKDQILSSKIDPIFRVRTAETAL
jgi:hypothetical protein